MSNSRQPLVSVIVPAHNAEGTLAEAVESALAQTYPDIEVIIVDDGSSDTTPRVAECLGKKPRVRAFRQDNAGPAAARNRGIAEARSEYVAFLDADDLWLPEKTAKQLELFRKAPDLGLVYCLRRGRILDENRQWTDDEARNRRYERATYYRGNCFRQMVEHVCISLSSAMVPRAVLDAVGTFDTELVTAEDRHLYARIAHDYPIDYVDEPLVVMRRHGSNLSRRPDVAPQTLDFLRRIAARFPECSLSERGWMRDAYARTARQTGEDALLTGRSAQARRELWEACKYRPLSGSNWCYFAVSLMPKLLLDAARRLKRYLRGSREAP
jgi:glycosyltransferase involved in cell wall biosynthesis